MTKKMSAKEKAAFYQAVAEVIEQAENMRRWRMETREDENGDTIRDENGEPVYFLPENEYDRTKAEGFAKVIEYLNEL